MILFPFVRRSAFAALESFCDTEIWRLERENKTLKEREAARAVCMVTLEAENRALKNRNAASVRIAEENQRLREENRELRHRLDLTRADLTREQHKSRELLLMKDSLEARYAAMNKTEEEKT